jgi:hypothetical protein
MQAQPSSGNLLLKKEVARTGVANNTLGAHNKSSTKHTATLEKNTRF